MHRWFLNKRASKVVTEEPVRPSDEELAARIEAKLSAGRIRAAADAALKDAHQAPKESTFETSDDDLVFIPDGSNIGVEELESDLEYDPGMFVDFGREVTEVETAWGSIGTREEAQFKKELRKK